MPDREHDQVGGMLTELAQQYALDLLGNLDLTEAVVRGPVLVRDGVMAGLVGDARLAELGLALIGVRITGVVADPDVQRALQTPARVGGRTRTRQVQARSAGMGPSGLPIASPDEPAGAWLSVPNAVDRVEARGRRRHPPGESVEARST